MRLLSGARLEAILARLPALRVGVVGDFFLDGYLLVDPDRAEVSRETGRTAHQVVGIRSSPGGAGNVAANLAALGVGRVEALGVIGDDGAGCDLRRALRRLGVDASGLRPARGRLTPAYLKPLRCTPSGVEELERLDLRTRDPLPAAARRRVVSSLAGRLTEGLDAVVLVDQVEEPDCGLFSDSMIGDLEALAAAHAACPFVVDSRARIGSFRGMILKPNREEAARALGTDPPTSVAAAVGVGRRLLERGSRAIYLTLGADGIVVCADATAAHVPAVPVEGPLDVTGAGDSMAAGLTAALAVGAAPREAAALGALCAAVTIRQLGATGTATPAELRALLRGWVGSGASA